MHAQIEENSLTDFSFEIFLKFLFIKQPSKICCITKSKNNSVHKKQRSNTSNLAAAAFNKVLPSLQAKGFASQGFSLHFVPYKRKGPNTLGIAKMMLCRILAALIESIGQKVIKRNAQKKWRTSDKNISFISYRQKQL
jgi:hypothetical protein